MKWSILICTLENRKHFLERLLNILLPQIGEYTVECDVYTGSVEIRILSDNKEMRDDIVTGKQTNPYGKG